MHSSIVSSWAISSHLETGSISNIGKQAVKMDNNIKVMETGEMNIL
jgi:hypothetical protein